MITDKNDPEKNNLPVLLTGVILMLACFVFFRFAYQYHLFFIEQMQLFMLSLHHFLSYFEKPAALSGYLGDFLVQFYYLRGGGAIVITLVLTVVWLLSHNIIKTFATKNSWNLLSFTPALSLAILHLDIRYPLSYTISFLLTLLLLWVYISTKGKKGRTYIFATVAFLGFWLVGFASTFFFIPALLHETINKRRSRLHRMALPVLFSALALVTPFTLRLYFALTPTQLFTYPITDESASFLLLTPFLFFLLTLLLHSAVAKAQKVVAITAQTLIIGTLVLSGGYFRANFDLEKTLSIDSELYFNNIARAAHLSKKHNLKSSAGAYYHNLIHAMGESMPDYFAEGNQTGVKGLFLPVDYQQNYITITFSNEVFYYLGDVNASQHFALLGTIFSPKQQSSRLMRRLVQINIINGEYRLADKYLKMLEKTLFHSKWAKQIKPLITDEALRNKSLWITQKRRLLPNSMQIKKSNDHETTLRLLLEANPENTMALDYLLCYYLMQKNLNAFLEVYAKQIKQYSNRPIPKIYQQALLICHAQNPENAIWAIVKTDSTLLREFSRYTDQFEQYKGNGAYLKSEFDNTYWFYYHYASGNEE